MLCDQMKNITSLKAKTVLKNYVLFNDAAKQLNTEWDIKLGQLYRFGKKGNWW